MTINLSVPTNTTTNDLKPQITVIGVGGAGGNAVNNMIESGLEGVEFVVANSDAQALSNSKCDRRIQIGLDVTRGLGAGSNPDIGRAAAEESLEEILGHIQHSNMLFVTAGLGGGTGTGAAPVIAQAARNYGILTVGVVTKPFHFEGNRRMRLAEDGLIELQQYVDTLLIIPNQNLFYVANERTTFADAFEMADQVLYSGVRGVTDLMVMPGLINLDFADIKSVMSEMGKAMMGTGEAEGENRAVEAAEAAISNPLLDDSSMHGARGVLINITAGKDITLFEVDEAANRIRKEVEDDANIIFGSTFDEALEGRVRVSVVATGIEAEVMAHPQPVTGQVLVKPEVPAWIDSPKGEAGMHQAEPMKLAPVAVFPRPEKTASLTARAPAPAAEAPTIAPAIGVPAGNRVEQTAPVATARSAEQRESFIPAPPVFGNTVLAEQQKADPFAVADLVNTRTEPVLQEPKKKTGPTLFERVTGVARGERRAARMAPSMPPAMEAAPTARVPEPTARMPEPTARVPEPTARVPELDAQEIPSASIEASQQEPLTAEFPSIEISEYPEISEIAAEPEAELAADPIGEPVEEAPEDGISDDQGTLGGFDLDDQGSAEEDSGDPLEIPAFLRRQAN
ncbi:MAG: cell division protein FtsZ [Rhodospirillales bacterium]|nr:cell division protein FtsZ [Rhodospirillales bacterium]